MAKFVVGVVSEGPTDFVVLQYILSTFAQFRGDEIELRRIQPHIDATSGRRSEGGWTQVYQWCVRNPPPARAFLFQSGSLFEGGDDPLDFLIVHMDTDIAEHILYGRYPLPQQGAQAHNLSSNVGRGAFVNDTIALWLDLSNDGNAARCLPAPAVECAETWLVAGLRRAPSNPEAFPRIMQWFIRAMYRSEGVATVPRGLRKLKKSESRYIRFLSRASPDVLKSQARCLHLRRLVARIFV
ncbi:MAG: hypothetical protein AB7O56_03335 [Bauldia sp.]